VINLLEESKKNKVAQINDQSLDLSRNRAYNFNDIAESIAA
jgi:hypothetical protein